ncbi:DUF2303 family protein [Comamonas thiooxydans]|uniref:DUF2303 family protein n=1 Tax=Comamonas thiooxydans TaxID=363952 RepID=UPI00069A4BD7|nr:DUF2303 family protein [Comamonas thiooxydans]
MNTQNEASSNQQSTEQSTLGNLISSIGLPPQYVNDQRDTRIEQLNDALQATRPTCQKLTVAAIPDNFNVEDLERYMPTRRRAAGVMGTPYINDFVAYTQMHKQDGCCIFVNADEMAATAVLDLGSPQQPGHCDSKAKLVLKPTAAFAALKKFMNMGKTQREMAEWLEDWASFLSAKAGDTPIAMPQAIAAVRSISIEAIAKSNSEEQALSSERTAFESVKVSATKETLPTFITMKCYPYPELAEREFVMRLSVTTDGKPVMALRPQGWEEAVEQMANEFATDLRASIENTMPVLIGTYDKNR